MRSQLRALGLMRPMVVPIMGEWASIVEPIMAVQLTGMVVQGTPIARVADRQPGIMARAALQVGAGAPLRGTMDREAPAVSEVARPRGVAAPGARPDGEAARSLGAAVVFAVADSGDEAASQPRDVSRSRTNIAWRKKRPANSFPPRRTAYVFPRWRVGNGVTSFNKALISARSQAVHGLAQPSKRRRRLHGPFFACLRVLQLNCFEVLPAHLRRICSCR
jgi:hypothetical protein